MYTIVLILLFAIVAYTLPPFIKRKTDSEDGIALSTTFELKYPKSYLYVAILLIMVSGGLCLYTAIESQCDWWAILPGTGVVVGGCLCQKVLRWKMKVYNDYIVVYPPLTKVYTVAKEEIIQVKRETKDTYSGIRERMVIKTSRPSTIVISDTASNYLKLREKLVEELEPRVLWGF